MVSNRLGTFYPMIDPSFTLRGLEAMAQGEEINGRRRRRSFCTIGMGHRLGSGPRFEPINTRGPFGPTLGTNRDEPRAQRVVDEGQVKGGLVEPVRERAVEWEGRVGREGERRGLCCHC